MGRNRGKRREKRKKKERRANRKNLKTTILVMENLWIFPGFQIQIKFTARKKRMKRNSLKIMTTRKKRLRSKLEREKLLSLTKLFLKRLNWKRMKMAVMYSILDFLWRMMKISLCNFCQNKKFYSKIEIFILP